MPRGFLAARVPELLGSEIIHDPNLRESSSAMTNWRFYQGLRGEWRWYQLDDAGEITTQCDQGFAELRACMANAEAVGFAGNSFHVYARDSIEPDNGPITKAESAPVPCSVPEDAAEGPPAS
jgi:hypothetical protein